MSYSFWDDDDFFLQSLKGNELRKQNVKVFSLWQTNTWAATKEPVNEVLISTSWISVIKELKQITTSLLLHHECLWMAVKWSWCTEGTTQYDVWQQQEELMINCESSKLVTTHSFIITSSGATREERGGYLSCNQPVWSHRARHHKQLHLL